MSWASVEEAASILGSLVQVPVSQADLDGAASIVEIYTGVTETTALGGRDSRLLKKAQAYQAAWMQAQVDLAGRSDATLVSQDGLQYSKGDQDMHVLAPLAKASIMRLSWMRTRTIDPLTPTQALALRNKVTAETRGLYDAEEGELAGDWSPM